MAISDFGESLLGQQRKRREKEQRKTDRQALLGTAATVGIGLYRNNLRKKQAEFLDSQPIMDLRIQDQVAQKNNKRTDQYTSLITASGLNASNYFLKEGEKLRTEEALALYADDEEMLAQIKAGRHKGAIKKKAEAYRDRALKSYNDGLSFQREYNLSGGIDKAIETYNKNPKTVAGALLGFATKRDFEDESLRAINQSRMGRLIGTSEDSKLSALEQSYQQLGSLSTAMALEDLEQLAPDIESKYEMKLVKGVDDVTRVVTIESKFNRGTGKQLPSSAPNLIELNDPKALERAGAKKLNAAFDPIQQARLALTPEGFSEYIDALRIEFVTDEDRQKAAQEGTEPALVRAAVLINTPKRHQKAVDLWSKYATDPETARRTPTSEALNAAQLTWKAGSEAIELMDKHNVELKLGNIQKAEGFMQMYATRLSQVGIAYEAAR